MKQPDNGETWWEGKYGYALIECICKRILLIGVPSPAHCVCGRSVQKTCIEKNYV